MGKRYYVVTDETNGLKQLVNAASREQAVAQLAKRYTARPATPQDVAVIISAGGTVQEYEKS